MPDHLIDLGSRNGFVAQVDTAVGSLRTIRRGQTILLQNHAPADLTFNIEGLDVAPVQLLECTHHADLRILALRHLYKSPDGSLQFEVKQSFSTGQADAFQRLIDVTQIRTARKRRLLHVTLRIEDVIPGNHRDVKVSAPAARFVPGTPMAHVLRRPRRYDEDWSRAALDAAESFDLTLTSPDVSFAAVTFEQAEPAIAMTILPRPSYFPVKSFVYGLDGRCVVEQEFRCESWLQTGEPWLDKAVILNVARQRIHLSTQPLSEALRGVGEDFPTAPPDDRPDDAANLSILEIDIEHMGGLRGVTERLPQIKAQGFDTIYLMPWHLGGYGTKDYEQVNPKYGTFDDLKALTAAAHGLGLRVLFDLLVNIASKDSRYVTEHPDWFYQDEHGQPLPHPMWKGPCFDPGSPAFRRFLTDYSLRCCTEWGADGFRVDAVAHRGANWNGDLEHAYNHSDWVFGLVGQIREAIREVNPNAILLAETFGPAQVPISDLVCWQWIEFLDWLLKRAVDGTFDGATLQRIVAQNLAMYPPQTRLVFYTHTHDTVAFAKRDIEGPAVDALLATLAFIGSGVMVFAGGWKMRQRPGEEEQAWYQAMLQTRQRLGGVTAHEVEFPSGEDPALFIAERPSPAGRVRIVTNFSTEERPWSGGERSYSRLGSPSGRLLPFDTVIEAT
jgi:hypothetical protein